MKDLRDVIIRPIVSEKSFTLLEQNVFAFEVHKSASKPEIRDAVETIFDVSVLKVNTLNRKGKLKRNRRKPTMSKRPDVKRAYVTLAEGDSIELFEV
ncbi:MAG: 50S ribosomal protein L23 [Acidimicrobiales bacterium]|jgi:large subunit ribosomal protein L23|nr:50S ribosomal protein L23 [Acidimicrobiales bacterium]MEC7809607.1 50S ribosomal protein L23 [Actinomycetota bacterium]|tara:strand:+ start:1389 stop:1679 length:291 start_codon:yes stop_codon:yes gene_type:complete